MVVALTPSKSLAPKHLIISILHYENNGVGVPLIIHAAKQLGLTENATRVALSRLKHEGSVASKGQEFTLIENRPSDFSHGITTTGFDSARACFELVQLKREIIRGLDKKEWKGDWLCCRLIGAEQSIKRRRSVEVLLNAGFLPGMKDMFIRPNYILPDSVQYAESLQKLGLEAEACIFVGSHFEKTLNDKWESELWDTEGASHSHHTMRRRLERSMRNLYKLQKEAAVKEVFTLLQESTHIVALNPILPQKFGSDLQFTLLLKALERYEVMYDIVWHQFLKASLLA